MLLLLSCMAPDSAMAEVPLPQRVPHGPPPAGFDRPKHPQLASTLGGNEAKLVQVLDVDVGKGLVAFKLIDHIESWPDMGVEPAECGYAGMEDQPGSGVTLALFKVNEARVQSWDIYALAMEPSECTPHAESEKRLAAAKKAFADAGLDIKKKPPGVKPDDLGVFDLGGVKVHTWNFSVAAEDEDYAKWTGQKDPDFADAHTKSGLRLGEQVLVTLEHTYSRNGAGAAGAHFPLAWHADGKAIFLVRDWSRHMRAGTMENWTFTPVVSLK